MDDRTPTSRTSADVVAGSPIPRVQGLPLLGSLPALLHRRFDFFDRAREQYGDIFVLDLGVREVVVVADPIAAEEIFVTRSKNFDKGEEFWNGAREAVGNGLVLSDGELWRRQRRLMNPEFRRERIAGFRATIEATVDEMLDDLERLSVGEPTIDISAWTTNLLSTLTVRLLMGGELEPDTFARLRGALAVLLDGILAGIVTRKLPAWIPVPGASQFDEARKTIDEILLQLITQRRAASDPGTDLLGMLLAATDEEGKMSDQQLRDEAVVVYIAGYETTAWAVAWGLMLLSEHSKLVSELQAEVDAHDLMSIPLLDATVRETLRLYPSVPFLPRRAVVDEQLLGYPIPAETTVLVLPWLIHRNPKYWPDPTRFDPRRHLDASSGPRLAWMPFGAGQRICIGQGLALMEANVCLGKLLRRFTPMPGRGHRRSEPRLSATLSSRDGIWIRLRRRAEGKR